MWSAAKRLTAWFTMSVHTVFRRWRHNCTWISSKGRNTVWFEWFPLSMSSQKGWHKHVINRVTNGPLSRGAMSSLGGINSFVFPPQAPPRREFSANSVQGLPCKNKALYSPETQHGRCVIGVYNDNKTPSQPTPETRIQRDANNCLNSNTTGLGLVMGG